MGYHTKTVAELFSQFHTSEIGLDNNTSRQRLLEHGYNELVMKKKASMLLRFLSQFKDLMMVMLIIAAFISFAVGTIESSKEELTDAAVITVVILLNALIGFIQEFKAERSLDALRKMVNPVVKVVRQGELREIAAKELVPGDIIVLEEGDKVPADIRLIESNELQVDQSALTGESVPQRKSIEAMNKEEVSIADMNNIVFMGTVITKGRGKGIVISTGMQTEFGKIAHLTTEVQNEMSPLQKELHHVGKFIALNVFIICVIVFLAGILMKNSILKMFLLAISLAVAAVPEGLPAIVTITLALGVQRLVKKKAIIRKLTSVETLGSTTVICSDKTGTLTKNEMTVQQVYVNGELGFVSGIGYDPIGDFTFNEKKIAEHKELRFLLEIGVLCNNAEHTKENKIIGDPTEGALVVSAKKFNMPVEALRKEHRRLFELPFDSKRKMMTTVNEYGNEKIVLVKGAPDEVLKNCEYLFLKGKEIRLSKAKKEEILAMNKNMASHALRVLGFAYKKIHVKEGQLKFQKGLEEKLVFVGLQAMLDPPRPEVYDAVKLCKEAGIRIFIVSGDHGITTKAIAEKLGISQPDTPILTGIELNNLKDEELKKRLEGQVIFARVDPEHKMRIVSLLKEMGEIVAVTGDGVNDAPAIKKADIGVAMGIAGTDVSKEASDMVLMDDSFATIITAIKEGRTIYNDIKKFMKYIFTCNLGELITVFLSILLIPLLGLPPGTLIISATQILWINLVTDVFPALALGVEPSGVNVMKNPPRDPKKRIITRQAFLEWLVTGCVIAAGTLAVFIYYRQDLARATTMAFCVLVFYQMMNVFNCRSSKTSLFKIGFFRNTLLLLAVFSSIALQIMIVQVSVFNDILDTVALSFKDWMVVLFVSLTVILYDEVRKAGVRRRMRMGVQNRFSSAA
ncbi:MAG: calcium-translocating P-type ATPase, SERCA-type [Nanoarchaeota archaeon]